MHVQDQRCICCFCSLWHMLRRCPFYARSAHNPHALLQRFTKKAPATPEAAAGVASASPSPASAARQPRRLDFPYQQLFSPPPQDKRCGSHRT